MSISSIPSLQSLALASASLNLTPVPEEALLRMNKIKFNVWRQMKDEVPASCKELMETVEEKVLPDQLESSVDLLFHLFSSQMSLRYHPVMGHQDAGMIPHLQLHELENRYQRFCENQALETLWNDWLLEDFTELGAFDLTPPPQGHDAIRAWLASANNTAFVQQITYIQLINANLEYLPPEIGLFTNLESLCLDNNMLRMLPESLCNLIALRRISLTSNKLTCLPNAFGNLHSLQEALLHNNQLKSLPASISSLTNLHSLQLAGNHLSTLPPSICNLPALATLNLNNNKLCALPIEIGNLPSLEELHFWNNFLFTLPASILDREGTEFFQCSNNQSLIGGNPFIFNMNSSNRSSFQALKFRWKHLIQCSPESDLGKLFYAIGTQKPLNEIKKIITSMNPTWQENIINCSNEGIAQEIALIKSGDQEALFIARLSASIQMAVSRTFSDLPPAQKDKIYDEIAAMNGISENCAEWGKEHAFDNILLFVDALEKTLNPSE
ncbi:MAG: leucine-rich repeat domain-containing protein [Parachlamydiales bacterium]|nr:leucine-rich repeat domain-containing protein [Candidatus Acheromyda pituitae]